MHVLLFGGFAALSLGAMALFDARARRTMTAQEWSAVRQGTAMLSLRPLADSGWRHANGRTVLRRAGISLLIYLRLVALHEPVIGVWPLPR